MRTFFQRVFVPEIFKGQKNYIKTQTKFEIIKTILLFGVSAALFIAGYITTKSKVNLLTIVAVIGCLPASKSLVNMIMFLRYRSLDNEICQKIEEHAGNLPAIYDNVFTSYDKNFQVDHLVYKDKCLVGFSTKELDEEKLKKHLTEKLLVGGHKNITIKIFNNLDKYIERLDQLTKTSAENPAEAEPVLTTLRAISL